MSSAFLDVADFIGGFGLDEAPGGSLRETHLLCNAQAGKGEAAGGAVGQAWRRRADSSRTPVNIRDVIGFG
jgi:hypothetical protein